MLKRYVTEFANDVARSIENKEVKQELEALCLKVILYVERGLISNAEAVTAIVEFMKERK